MLSLIIIHLFNLFKMNEETTNQIQLLFSGFCFIIWIKVLSKSKEELMEHSLTLVKSMQFGQEDCFFACLLYTSPSPRDATLSRMPSSA